MRLVNVEIVINGDRALGGGKRGEPRGTENKDQGRDQSRRNTIGHTQRLLNRDKWRANGGVYHRGQRKLDGRKRE
jgi:hypothetical protein